MDPTIQQHFNNTSVDIQIENNDPLYPLQRPEGWCDVLMVEALGTGTHYAMPSNVEGDFGNVEGDFGNVEGEHQYMVR